MSELELIVDLHKSTERQGPGSIQHTLKALDLIHIKEEEPLKIADLGCGTGAASLTLAKSMDSKIVALDIFPEFLKELDGRSKSQGLESQIKTVQGSMDDLPFQKEEFDIIWSEGAVYNIGFEKGIREWKDYLKPEGAIAVSEITWTTEDRPKEIEDFWESAYPEISSADKKIEILESNGYSLLGYFFLPSECWTSNYYEPLKEQFSRFLDEHKNNPLAQKVVNDTEEEIQLYQKFGKYYSYGFYIAKKMS